MNNIQVHMFIVVDQIHLPYYESYLNKRVNPFVQNPFVHLKKVTPNS